MTAPDLEPPIGFVGLGSMGAVMAGHILASGRGVIGWDQRAEAVAAFVAAGGMAANGFADLAACPLVISIVFDDQGTREIALAPGGLVETLAPGAIHVVMASISPALSRELFEAHAARGQHYLAASVFGRPEAAAAADLLINASGSPDAYRALDPIFAALGRSQWVGPEPEQAMLVKIMGNTMIVAAVQLLREMFGLLSAGGISEADAKAVLVDQLFPGPIFSGYAQRYIDEPASTRKTAIAAKDNALCLKAAEALKVDMPLVRFLAEKNLP